MSGASVSSTDNCMEIANILRHHLENESVKEASTADSLNSRISRMKSNRQCSEIDIDSLEKDSCSDVKRNMRSGKCIISSNTFTKNRRPSRPKNNKVKVPEIRYCLRSRNKTEANMAKNKEMENEKKFPDVAGDDVSMRSLDEDTNTISIHKSSSPPSFGDFSSDNCYKSEMCTSVKSSSSGATLHAFKSSEHKVPECRENIKPLRSRTFVISRNKEINNIVNAPEKSDGTIADVDARINNFFKEKMSSVIKWFESQMKVQLFLQSQMYEHRLSELEDSVYKQISVTSDIKTTNNNPASSSSSCRRREFAADFSDLNNGRRNGSVTSCDAQSIDSQTGNKFCRQVSNLKNYYEVQLRNLKSELDVYKQEISEKMCKNSPKIPPTNFQQDDSMNQKFLISTINQEVLLLKEEVSNCQTELKDIFAALKVIDQSSQRNAERCSQLAELRADVHSLKEEIGSGDHRIASIEEFIKANERYEHEQELRLCSIEQESIKAQMKINRAQDNVAELYNWQKYVDDRMRQMEMNQDNLLRRLCQMESQIAKSDQESRQERRTKVAEIICRETDDGKMATRHTSIDDEVKNIQEKRTYLKTDKPAEIENFPTATEDLQTECSVLMQRKRQLESKMSRVPMRQKRQFEQLEDELNQVEKRLARVKLDLRQKNTKETF